MKEQLKHYIQEHMEEYKYLVNDLYDFGNRKSGVSFHACPVQDAAQRGI